MASAAAVLAVSAAVAAAFVAAPAAAEARQDAQAQDYHEVQAFAVQGMEAWGVDQPDLLSLRVRLVRTDGGWAAAPAGDTATPVRTLGQLLAGQASVRLSASALGQISAGVPSWMLERHGRDYGPQALPAYSIDDQGVAVFSIAAPGPGPGEELFSVSGIRVDGLSGDGLTLDEVREIQVALTPVEGGLIGQRAGLESVWVTLGELESAGEPVGLYSSAIQSIAQSVVRAYNAKGLRGIRINAGRPDEAGGVLALAVTEGVVGDVRTVTLGSDGETINAPAQRRFADRSPVRSGGLVNIRSLDDFVFYLNRRPGRRVDIALAPGPGVDELTLDYLVAETKPLSLYFQMSNTGTEQTKEWRQRFGLTHYSLTGVDDTLSVDYVTASFDDVHALMVSYERPFEDLSKHRWRAYASYLDYTASEVGFAGQGFEGLSYGGGLEWLWNFHQERELFFDLVAGARYEWTEVENNLAATKVNNSFFLPYLGVKMQRSSDRSETTGLLMLEGNLASVGGTDGGADLDGLGRLDTSTEWIVAKFDVGHSFYLDPLFQKDWGGEGSTLAHEVFIGAKGQVSFDDRLPPNFVQTAGGFYSVRGYPESFSFGDRVYQATAEYRFHLPKALAPGEPTGTMFGEPFRTRPQQWLGSPDWDLVFRGFIDAGYAEQIDKLPFESDTTLVGAGVGVELSIRRNVNLRCDWGFALRDESNGDVEVTSGSSQVHLMFTLVY